MSIASVSHHQVFGLKQDIKDNLYTVDDETILYPAGSNVLITQKGHRKFISVTEKGDSISSLTVSPDRHFLAIGEKGSRPSINVFDITSIRKRRTLYACSETISAKEFISLGFSSDSKYMAAQLCGPEWILHYYAWDKGKLIATINSHSDNPESTVLQVSVNPSDGTVIFVLGDNFVKQYRYTEGELLKIEVDVPKNIFKTHSWLNGDFVAIGTEDGKVLILNPGGSITQEIQINSTFLSKISLPASNNPSVMNQNICSSTHQMQQNLGASQSNSNFSIESIVVTNTGLIAGSKNGNIVCFDNSTDIETGNRKYIPNKKFLVPDGGVVRTMAIASTEAHLLVELESNQILKIPLIIKQEEQFDEIKFEAISEAFHHGQILGLDLCCRKPLLVTCSNDKSIRLWNYVTGQCELIKYYPEEAYSVSLHPSGLYLLVGFSDKLRFLNVLMDDFRFFKEFSIRGCKECKFSNGGHIFAAVHGNTIQVYSTWTFENICVLKGHNGKVKSLYWSPDDNFIVSAGADGAIYTWNIRDLKRESEYILKTCAFSSAICTPNGKVVYAVGSDKMVKEITESQVTCEFDGGIVATQICLSHSGKMLFVGTANGSIRSIKFPFTSDPDSFQEHFAHSGAITNLRMSFDDQYLFSASEDGCIYSFRVSEKEERGIKRERILLFADEILITKSDLEEKNVLMTEMQSTFNELKLEHEYQLRLKDLSFTDKLKELTETYSQEIEGLKILTSVLRTVKDKEEVKHEEEVMHVKATHGQELHEIESKYNSQLMAEYDKFQEAQTLMAMHQEDWLGQVKEFEFITQKMLQDTQAEYENKLKLKSAEISRLQEEMRQDSNEFAEMIRQNEEDIDIEIANLINKYEKKLRIEKDEGARLKGENGIMRKKFNTLTKDIDDNKSEIEKMRDDEKKLNFVISTLEKEILGLKKEMHERDELIQDKEKRVYDLKKKNQELEKYKFVLDYNIKYLKQQVEPRENHIAEMTNHIQDINQDLESLNKSKSFSELKIEKLNEKLKKTKQDYTKKHQKVQDLFHYLKGFKTDFQDLMKYIQEPAMLKKATENLNKKYCSEMKGFKNNLLDPDVKKENLRHQELLKSKIQDLSVNSDSILLTFRADDIHTMTTNQSLLNEINELRNINKHKPLYKNKIIKLKNKLSEVESEENQGSNYRPSSSNVGKLPLIRGMSSPLPPVPTFQRSKIQLGAV